MKKLMLNKEIVAKLNNSEMIELLGGNIMPRSGSDATTCIGTNCGASYCLIKTCNCINTQTNCC